MKSIFPFVERIAPYFLRFSLAFVILWIGVLHFTDPTPGTKWLRPVFPFLAFTSVIYVLGTLETIAAILFFAGVWLRYVGLLCLILFAGTLLIFVTTPSVTGFPALNLQGQFLLKDLVLAAAAWNVAAIDSAKQARKRQKVAQVVS